MPRYIVLLRGVNVSKGNRVPMAGFKRLLEDLGCTQVTTVLNSGNAVVSWPGRSGAALAHAVGASLQQHFGVVTPVLVRSAAAFAAVVERNPMPPSDEDHSRFLVVFAQDAAALQALAPLAALVVAPERFEVTDVAAYLSCPAGLLASKVGTALVGKAGAAVTTRNWATVMKLQALLQGNQSCRP